MTSHDTPQGCDVIYNGACPVCAAGIEAVRDQPSDPHYIDIAASPGRLAGLGLTPRDVQYRLYALTAGGRLVRGIDAVAETLRLSPRWRWAGRLAGWPVFRQLGWIAYEITAFFLFRWNRWKGNF